MNHFLFQENSKLTEDTKEPEEDSNESEDDEEAEALITNLQNLAFATSRSSINMKRTTRIPLPKSANNAK